MSEEQVILVDEQDNEIGVMEKLEAHKKGHLHRAFSVFIFNSRGEMLLQQRAAGKYHSGSLWTNTCCSHPRPFENVEEAAGRRLMEEMGFRVPLEKNFEFVYKADFSNGLTEYEFDHVFTGEYDGPVVFNKLEVSDYCYKSIEDVRDNLQAQPHKFSEWFRLAFPKIETWWKERNFKPFDKS